MFGHLVTYVSGSAMSTVDYLLLRIGDQRIMKYMKVIGGEKCVSQHQLFVGDCVIKGARRKKKKMHTPRLKDGI